MHLWVRHTTIHAFHHIGSTVEDHHDSAYDSKSASIIKLSNGMVLYLREVTKCA